MYYALASMIEPRIRVDYTLTQAEVFIKFAEMMLEHDEWVWVFSCAAERAMVRARANLCGPRSRNDCQFC
jgi:hypothetical protein